MDARHRYDRTNTRLRRALQRYDSQVRGALIALEELSEEILRRGTPLPIEDLIAVLSTLEAVRTILQPTEMEGAR